MFNCISSLTNTRFPEAMTTVLMIIFTNKPKQLDDSEPPTSLDTISFSVICVFNGLSILDTVLLKLLKLTAPVQYCLELCHLNFHSSPYNLFMLSITRLCSLLKWIHLITPVLKSVDKANIRNYWLVSLLHYNYIHYLKYLGR